MRLRQAALAALLLAAGLAVVTISAEPAAQAAPGRPTTFFPDSPDPHVLRVGSRYYAYTTNRAASFGGLIHLPVLWSTDLRNWTEPVDAMANLASWVEPGRTWAPTVVRDGEGFVLFYSATERSTGRQCIGKARSRTPVGPFRDTRRGPVVCQRRLGGSIDPYVFRAPNGNRYLYWKNDGNCCGLRVSLWGQRLRADERLAGHATNLLSYDRAWERPLIENPAMTYAPSHGAEFRLFYAANWYDSQSYATGYARCATALGPCRKVTTQRPWHGTTRYAYGPGGASFFTDSGGRNWMAEHGWSRPPDKVGYPNGGRRSLFIEKVDFSDRRPRVNTTFPYAHHRNPPYPFVDVPAWADAAVTWAWAHEIVTGYPDGPDRTFRPDLPVSRGDAMRQVRLARPGHHVDTLRRTGVAITRGQAARLLYQAAGEPGVRRAAFDHELTDVGAPPALRAAVRWIVHDPDGAGGQQAVASGFPDHTFRPEIELHRAAFIRMLHRLITAA